jgi:hypothetical protein
MGAAPGIQLGIGPESADTLETTLVPQALRVVACICVKQPTIHTATRRTPCRLPPYHQPACHLRAGWPQQQVMGGGVPPYRRTGCSGGRRADISDVQRDLATVDSLLQTLRQSVPTAGRLAPLV